MKAIVHHQYGEPDVLLHVETAKPTPGDDDVLIRVHSAAVNPLDRMFRGRPYAIRLMTGLLKPRDGRLGNDVAGEVEAVGRNVTRFKPGDAVFGACRGAYAEYACAREKTLVTKPENLTFDEAAAAPVAGLTALQGLRDKGRVQPGQKVLINGAAGGVGTFAVQIAKSLGAHVTGVCSTRNVDMVRSIGADRVIDYTREDFTESAERYDIIFEGVGNRSLSDCKRVLQPNGIHLLVGSPKNVWRLLPRVIKASVLSRFGSQTFALFVAKVRKEDLTVLAELMSDGRVKPVIDRRYPLSEVPEAIRYLEEGHARGKIVITMRP